MSCDIQHLSAKAIRSPEANYGFGLKTQPRAVRNQPAGPVVGPALQRPVI